MVNTQHQDHATSGLHMATYCTETGDISKTSESPPKLDRSVYDDETTDDPQELPSLPSSSDSTHQSRSSKCSEAPTQRVSSYGRPIRVPLRYRDTTDTQVCFVDFLT